MAKILLVEDDNNLREIYQARLEAEGYETSSAQDGEEALVVAKQEKPDLVISDVMMPKISGFEMLDILRNTQGLEDTKVIMLTALGQAEDREQADSLGADKYLVKSQVTLEDIVKTAHELLGGDDGTEEASASDSESSPETAAAPAQPETPAAQPQIQAQPVAVAPEPPAIAPAEPAEPPASSPVAEPTAPQPTDTSTQPEVTPAPSSDTPEEPAASPASLGGTAAQEESDVNKQINDFVNNQPPAAAEPTDSSAANPAAPSASSNVAEPAPPTDATSAAAPDSASPVTPPEPTTTAAASSSPAADTTAQAQPAAASQDNQASDDKLMADAVNQLANDSQQPSDNSVGQTASPAATNPTPSMATEESGSQEMPTSPARKVISPVQQEAKPNIHELLAKEEGSSQPAAESPASTTSEPQAGSMPTPSVPPQPTNPPAGTPGTPPPSQPSASDQDNQQDGFDPSSVAL